MAVGADTSMNVCVKKKKEKKRHSPFKKTSNQACQPQGVGRTVFKKQAQFSFNTSNVLNLNICGKGPQMHRKDFEDQCHETHKWINPKCCSKCFQNITDKRINAGKTKKEPAAEPEHVNCLV